MFGQLFGRAGRHLSAALELRTQFGVGQGLVARLVQAVDDGPRRSCGHKDRVPCAHIKARAEALMREHAHRSRDNKRELMTRMQKLVAA